MKSFLKLPALVALLLITTASFLTGCVATAPATAVVVRPRPYPPQPYYRPYRTYYRPAPAVIVRPRPVIVAPAPRPYYGGRPHRYVRVR